MTRERRRGTPHRRPHPSPPPRLLIIVMTMIMEGAGNQQRPCGVQTSAWRTSVTRWVLELATLVSAIDVWFSGSCLPPFEYCIHSWSCHTFPAAAQADLGNGPFKPQDKEHSTMIRALIWPEGATRRKRQGREGGQLSQPMVASDGARSGREEDSKEGYLYRSPPPPPLPSLVEIRDAAVISGSFLAVSFVRDMRASVAVYRLEALQPSSPPVPSESQFPSSGRAGDALKPPPPALRVSFIRLVDFGPAVCELSISSALPPSRGAHLLLHPGYVLKRGDHEAAIDGQGPSADPSLLSSLQLPLLRVSFSTSVIPQTTKDICLECGREVASQVEEVRLSTSCTENKLSRRYCM